MQIRRILHTSRKGRILVSDQDPGPVTFSISRAEDGRLEFEYKTKDHRWHVDLNKAEEQELLAQLKFV